MNYKPLSDAMPNKFWIWTVVNLWNQGILLWTVGGAAALALRDRSHQTFEQLWQIIKCWESFWYVTDGWKVYPMYIQPEDHLVSKTYMTRVEGENTRLRHPERSIAPKNIMLLQILGNA